MTVLEIIQEVQKKLRLPQSLSLTDSHAKLILSLINDVQRNLLAEQGVWDEAKVYGSFNTVSGTATATISVSGQEIEIIRNLKIGTSPPIEKVDDDDFREYKRVYSTGQPLYYRIYSKSGGGITVEFSPTPDAVYQIDYEVLKKPPRLVNSTDVPLLDADTLIAGTVTLAKHNQGQDVNLELSQFQAKLGMQVDSQGESGWGDVEAV